MSTVGSGTNPDVNDVDTEIERQREIIADLQRQLGDTVGSPREAVETCEALRGAIEGLRVLTEIANPPA